MILLIDNYDSFVYNIYQMVGIHDPDIRVIRNDAFSVHEVLQMQPERILLSPGPGHPEDAGILPELIRDLPRQIPLLGICLGHQALALAGGSAICQSSKPVHGKTCKIKLQNDCPLFHGVESPLSVGRYHSLFVDRNHLGESFEIIAEGPDQMIMGIAHQEKPQLGLQFHPESILSEQGDRILHNFLCHYPAADHL